MKEFFEKFVTLLGFDKYDGPKKDYSDQIVDDDD